MITGIILAAGFSRRFGENKLLAEIDGVKILERVVQACKESSLDKIILVYRNKEVEEIGNKYNIETVYNPDAHLGQSESVRLGVGKAENSDAYMFLMGDQPFITGGQIDKLIDEFKGHKSSIIVPYYKGKKGTPTIFPSIYKEALLNVKGDKGGKNIIEENLTSVREVYIDDEKSGLDIDEKEDLIKLAARLD